MARKGHKLQQMVEEAYDDEDVRQHVLDSAAANATVDKIESGELVLPHPIDARRSMEEEQRRKQQEKK